MTDISRLLECQLRAPSLRGEVFANVSSRAATSRYDLSIDDTIMVLPQSWMLIIAACATAPVQQVAADVLD
jgi:hypothetical protein